MAEIITVTIGRNVGDEPMWADDWEDFTNTVTDLFETVVFRTIGQSFSSWGREESYTVGGELHWWVDIDAQCQNLCDRFDQDAIAIGRSRLIERG